jgi:hypothetical protein
MIKLKQLIVEGKLPIFRSGSQAFDYIHKHAPEFDKYWDDNASYDDIHYKIPMKLITKKFGWTSRDIDKMSNNFESYEGWCSISKDGFLLIGNGA